MNEKSGLVDFDGLKVLASLFRPKILIAGASAYPRNWDYAEMKNVFFRCYLVDCKQLRLVFDVRYCTHKWNGGSKATA